MPAYRLIYFRSARLDRAESIEAPDTLAALHEAARRPSNDIVELWSEDGKIATFRPASRHATE